MKIGTRTMYDVADLRRFIERRRGRAMSNTTWPKATREHPCPKCGKSNRCLIAPDGGAGICWRSGTKEVWHDGTNQNGDGHASGYVGAAHRKPTRKSTARGFATREAAIDAALENIRRENPDAELTRVFEYHMRGGALLFCVARFDWPGDKTFRPVHLHKGEWREGDPSGLMSLYHVNDFPDAGPIYVCEGETACEAARSKGLPATTSAGTDRRRRRNPTGRRLLAATW